MKLSEAIRLGSMLKPQAFGTVFDGKGTCAVGAAKDAVGKLHLSFYYVAHAHRWDANQYQWNQQCPVCRGITREGVTCGMIPHLNDDHRWTREQIADWVEGVEAAQAHALHASDDAVRLSVESPIVTTRA